MRFYGSLKISNQLIVYVYYNGEIRTMDDCSIFETNNKLAPRFYSDANFAEIERD